VRGRPKSVRSRAVPTATDAMPLEAGQFKAPRPNLWVEWQER